jgi:CRP-like cAMP-binding protein/phosphoribosyl 1,2-cyclic phosphodiesterase
MLRELKETVTELPRGGYLAKTPAGYVQIGAPPETIKDTMLLPESTPQIFILPKKLFNADKGISLAELEFPIYYNFFIKKRKTTILCTKEQGGRLVRVLRESVFGPKEFDILQDVHIANDNVVIPNLKKEMNYYKTFRFRDFLSIYFFQDNRINYKDITVTINQDTDFVISTQGKDIATIPSTFVYKPKFDIGERLKDPYRPPLFGVTCLGPSHGFDPTENTSGFIIWLNHRGIMIDPPVNSTEWLQDSNVNPKLIDSIILTHCHADHDAGTFQKIMEEGKITIYTTNTVINSFLRKYSALSGESISYLKRLFTFNPAYLGKPFFIHGAEFNIFYSLHSIPAIGFKLNFQGQSFVYSSDHQGEPRIHQQLLKEGVISKDRYNQLSNFPWDSKVIYHEAGIPPLHTSINWLNSLSEEIKKKLVVYHIAKKDFPADSSITLAKFGMENTIYLDVMHPRFEKAYEILGILKHLDFFQGFPIEKVQEFVLAIVEEKYEKGEYIIRKGTKGERFYIIYSGNVAIYLDGLEQKKIYSEFEYFGEVALLTEQPTTADVVAETDVVVYTMDKNKFLSFISGTEFEATLRKLIKNRDKESWNILSTSRYFKGMTSFQKTWIESVLDRVELKGSGVLVKQGDTFKEMFIIRKGTVTVKRNGKEITVLGQGDFIGDLHYFDKRLPSKYTFEHSDNVLLFSVSREDMEKFAEMNPGLVMKVSLDF